MRIAHVSDCYLPRLGGIEVQVHSIAQRQLAAGHDVEVITATPPARHDRTSYEVVDGVTVHRITMDLPFELPVHLRVGREVAGLVERMRQAGRPYDAVHVHTGVVSPFAYGALPALTRAGLPTVVTVHSMWGPAWSPAWLGMRATQLVTRWGRWPVVLSAVSDAAAAQVRAVAGRDGAGRDVEVRVIPNGIEPADWQVDPEPRTPDDDVLVVAVMRLAPRKRSLPLLRMLRHVRADVPADIGLRALVIGEGPQRAAMQRFLVRAGMQDWVGLPGRWDRGAIRELYRRADVFVAPSTMESFGIAALEARTAGVPVVAMACTGVREFVTDGVEGALVSGDDEMVAAITGLVTSPQRRAAIALHNRTVAPPTTWDDVLARCDDAYAAARAVAVRHRS